MKILIAADIFPPESGGPATYSVGLANAFTKQGIDVTIVSLTLNSDASLVTCPVRAVRQKNKILRYFEYFWLLLREGKRADCIYAMGPVNAGLPALLASRWLRKPLVVKVVGDYAWEQGTQRFGVKELMDDFQNKKYHGIVGLFQKIESLVVRNARQVIVPSMYLQKIVTGWGAPPERVAVIYNAISITDVDAVKIVADKPAEEQWIVTVARLTPWKGIKEVIDALANLRSRFPHVKYKVVGDGPDRPRLEAVLKEKGAGDFVELLGNVAHGVALSYLKSSDVVVLNSGYEGLSHVLVEALNFDCRILVSNIGGNPEVIISGETGDVFPYNDVSVIEQKLAVALAGSMPKPFTNTLDRGQFFRKFQFNSMVAETQKVLEKICARS